jgi:hypothetical protein
VGRSRNSDLLKYGDHPRGVAPLKGACRCTTHDEVNVNEWLPLAMVPIIAMAVDSYPPGQGLDEWGERAAGSV